MAFFLIKTIVTALLIVTISEIAKVNEKLGGLIAALPITTLLIINWMYFEGVNNEKISNHMTYNLLFVIPTLPMFILFPFLINKFGFYMTCFISVFITFVLIVIFNYFTKEFGFKVY